MDTTESDPTKHYAWLGKLIAEDRNAKDSTCDLVLESERKQFPVHKNIMMLVSKYFKKMFTIEMKEKYEGIVKMLRIPHQRLANLIEFIYTGKIKITEENVTDILDDAEYTELEALKKICNTALLKLVSADNCLKLRAYAQRYNLDEVFVKTNQEITTSFAAVIRQDDFVQLDIDDMSAVIKLRNKDCEEALFTGIVKWVYHNPLQREELFVNLFSQVDLSQMNSNFIAQVAQESLVRNSNECLCLLVDAKLNVTQPTFTDKILIVGGNWSPTECVVYDVNTKQTTYLPKLNYKRVGATSVKVGSNVYVTGGCNKDVGKSCEMLNLDEPTKWNMMPSMLESHIWCGSGFIADHIYVTGGMFNKTGCEKFDIHNNKWMRTNNMLHARLRHGTLVCNGGRGDNDQYLSSVERLNPGIGKWENIASLQLARCLSSACVVDDKIYVIGGYDGEEDLTSVEVYDQTSNVWTIAFEMEKTVYGATVVAI